MSNKPLPVKASELLEIIIKDNPTHKKFIQDSLILINDDELKLHEKYLEFCEKKKYKMSYMAECYRTILEDSIKEQIYFIRNKEYRNKSYNDVAKNVYHNKSYMDKYMYGLAITSFLWPNHLKMTRFFIKTLPKNKKGKYLDIGPGHGYYLMKAMEIGSFDEYFGVDISEASINQTSEIIDHFQPQLKNKYHLKQTDFLEANELMDNDFNAIVMGEVLEHVEKPEVFLRRISELATEESYIFITTCINAPAIDHIYLWRTTEDLEQMILKNNLEIISPLRLPYRGKSLKESKEENLCINVAYVLKKSADIDS